MDTQYDPLGRVIPSGTLEQAAQATQLTAPPAQQSPRSMAEVWDQAMGNAVRRAADRLNNAGFYVDHESLRTTLLEEVAPVLREFDALASLRAAGQSLGEDPQLVDRVVAKRLGGQRRVGSATELIGE